MMLEQKILLALDEIRPFLQQDGGDIELIKIKNNQVIVRLTGNCHHCAINKVTLKSAVELTIQKHAPEITQVTNID